ncbi:MAG TPA: tripartite tricarboxylate transporter substrate binding protein [Burkholderiales bacterium]|jgi:tripartite-type tricarboxylate transporter receptor subunit TctC|nr:tripartite tricarboxylate transporter substrate binding protein [Burkholderiales bacterium]
MITEKPARLVVLALALAFASNAGAQAWPTKPVRMIIAFAPGGGTDIAGRLLAKRYTEALGQSFVVENRAGAGGIIGAEFVAKSPPDGYNILVTTASLSVNVNLQKLAFDPVKDLAPVTWIASVPLVLFVHSSVPAKSVKELVALAKKRPMNAGSNGAGTTSHLAIEMLNQATGINAVHVPYKGGGPAQIALLTGEIDFRFGSIFASVHHVRAGRYRALAVTTAKPSSLLPDVPTMNSIYPGFECDQWYAMFLPAGTPKDIVSRLNAETVKAINSDEMREQLKRDGAYPVGSTPEELAAMFKREVARYAKVIAAAKVKAD